jgi:prophage DNA circulation protein
MSGLSPNISSLSTTSLPASAANTSGVGSPAQVFVAGNGSVNDLFAKLLPASWNGIGFAVAEMEFEIRQDLVIHRYADRDGAYVESTGRHPAQFTFKIPFLNNIQSAPNENWPQGNLYPLQWRSFIIACLDGQSHTLVHPELGPINCKVDMARSSWSAKTRDGVWVSVAFVESDDTQADQLTQSLSVASPIGQLTASADDLDNQVDQVEIVSPLFAQMAAANQFSFSQLASAISAVIDIPTLLSKQYQGMADNLIYQCNQIETALDMAENASPLNWPLFQNCERLKASAYAVKAQPTVATSNGTGTLTTYVLQKDSTIGQLASQFGADVQSLIVLNAQYVSAPVIPSGAVVQYYKSAA